MLVGNQEVVGPSGRTKGTASNTPWVEMED